MDKGREEPRIYTPPLRDLTPDTTLGFWACDFAEQVLGFKLIPWQRWLLIHALEVIDTREGWELRFQTVIVLVGRQNGKTTLGTILALFFLYVLDAGLVIGTAQDVSQAEDTWQMCVDEAQANPELAEDIRHVWYTNGSKRLQLTGNRDYRVRASNRKAGRGKSADLVLLDELREHQTWEAWSALSKTGMAKKSALRWCMSNAGDGTSVVLRHFRIKAHAALGDPDGIAREAAMEAPSPDDIGDSAVALFEWSAPPGADKHDISAWAQANPSMGYTVPMRNLRAACADDPDDVFRTECLCQWVTASVTPPFPIGAWEAGTDGSSCIAPDSPLVFGVDVSEDRTKAAIAVCGLRSDRSWHVELVAYRSGVGWLQGWFADRAEKYRGMRVSIMTKGAPASGMAEIIGAVDGVEVVPCQGPDVGGWCGRFYDAVSALDPNRDPEAVTVAPIYHRPQPALDMAANIAETRPVGGAWAWDRRKSKEDISPLIAATIAYGAASSERKRRPSAYEGDGLMVL